MNNAWILITADGGSNFTQHNSFFAARYSAVQCVRRRELLLLGSATFNCCALSATEYPVAWHGNSLRNAVVGFSSGIVDGKRIRFSNFIFSIVQGARESYDP